MGIIKCWHPGADCMCRDGENCLTASGEYGVLFACGIDFQEEKRRLKTMGETRANDRAFQAAYEIIEARARGKYICQTA